MHNTIDLRIEPTGKYDAVILGYSEMEGPAWDDDHEADDSTAAAAHSYANTMENIQDAGDDASEGDTLTWSHLSVASDPDLVAKMATYFDGIYPDEPTERIRSKLRLLDVEVYATVQVAARSELRDGRADDAVSPE